MAKKEYGWKIGEMFPPIEVHSLTKHKVYEEYVLHYIKVLNANPRITNFRLTLVDGFAGGGVYTRADDNSVHDGSPIRLIRAAEAAAAAVKEKRRSEGIKQPFELSVDYYFLEKEKEVLDHLTWYLKNTGLGDRIERDIFPIQGQFTQRLDPLLADISGKTGGRRCIFILDQYGYSAVPFAAIRKIFGRLRNAEIILTFATDWLIDYMSGRPEFEKILERLGLRSDFDVSSILEQKSDNKQWRQFAQRQLHAGIFKQSGARFYTPFFIVSKESGRSFWLVHLSNHPRARDVMTELHWSLTNQFTHYGGPGLQMFGFDPRKDTESGSTIDLFSDTEYSFDEVARRESTEVILNQLPEMIHRHDGGISFDDFYRSIANQTPVTTALIREVAGLLVEGKELEVVSQKGARRLKANTIKGKDIIRTPPQLTFDFGASALLRGQIGKKEGE